MSKHCEVCNRSFPDDLAGCPHCAESGEVLDAVEIVEEAPEGGAPAAEPDSAVDLGMPALPSGSASGKSGEGSGLSVVEWAALVEEEPTPAEPAPAQFDDPADADLLRQAPAPAGADEDALASDLDAVRNIFGGDASASFARKAPPAAPAAADDDSALDLLSPELGPPPPVEAPARPLHEMGSGIDLGAEHVVEEAPSISVHESAAPALT